MKRKTTILREKKFTSISIAHSFPETERSLPTVVNSLITIQIGPWWPRTVSCRLVSCPVKRINIQPSRVQKHKFSLCTIGPHACIRSGRDNLIGLLCNYFINKPGGGAKPRNKRIWRRKRKENRRERGEKSRSEYLSGDRSARACNSHTLDSCTRFVPSVTSPCVTRPRLRAAPACTRCTG